MGQRAPIGLLAVAVATSAALLLSLDSHLTFVGDPWELLAGRPDWSLDTFLRPFNEHPIVLPALVYKTLLAVFGMGSAMPFYVVSTSLFLLCAVLLFVYLRRRVGAWAALAAAVIVLFLGAAYEDLLWEFQMGFFGSMAAGLGALLALDREDRTGDRLAAGLLLLATAFSTLGVPFIFAALAQILLRPGSRRRRLYVPLLPLGAYAAWWLVSGHTAGGQLGLDEIPELPRYLFDVASAGVASLLGRQPLGADGAPPLLAQLLVVVLVAALAYRIGRNRNLSPGLIVALTLVLSFWLLVALDRGPQRFSSRYQYPSAIFLLIVAAEAMRGKRLPRPAVAVLAAATVAAVIGGVNLLQQGYSSRWKPEANDIRATLAAVAVAGPAADPRYRISLPPSIFLPVEKYEEARRKHGTPAFSKAQLLAAEDSLRSVADATLIGAMHIGLRAAPGGRSSVACRTRTRKGENDPEVQLTPGNVYRLRNLSRQRVTLGLRRFAGYSTLPIGAIGSMETRALRLPADRSPRPWWLRLDSGPSIQVCV